MIKCRAGVAAVAVTVFASMLGACGGGASLTSFCLEVKKDKTNSSLHDAFNPIASTPASAKDAISKAVKEVSKLQGDAPSDIKPSFKTLHSALSKYQSALTKQATNDPQAALKAAQAIASDGPALEAANARIADYLKTKCGVDINS